MELDILRDLVVITGITIPVILLCHRLKILSIIGFLIAGVIIGPHGFSLIEGYDNITVFAELGVVALLFTIGLEFSFEKIWKIRTLFLSGGALQVTLTVAAATAIALIMKQPLHLAVFIGFLVSLSSTALVLSILQEQAKTGSPHGRISLAILIFQDIAVVAMILIIPFLAGNAADPGRQIISLIVKACALGALVFIAMKWVIPQVLYRVVKTGSREIFMFTVLFLCLSIGFLTSSFGLSLALGAFIAGLIISESDYGQRALGAIIPFKDVFSSFFFMSIGMLFDMHYFLNKPLLIIGAALGILVIKAAIGAFTVLMLRWPLSTAVLVGASICQIGEFSFILIQSGVSLGIIGEDFRQVFLGVALCTLFLTPLALSLAPALSGLLLKLPILRCFRGTCPEEKEEGAEAPQKDHLIIVGFGLVGKNLAMAAKTVGISYAIIEMNPDTVKTEQKNGEPILYGDATHEAILHHVNIGTARILVIAISDPAAMRGVTELARRRNRDLHIIVRTRFMAEVEELQALGADCVIPEEFETSVEIFTRVLKHYLIPVQDIERFTAQARAGGYRMFRPRSPVTHTMAGLLLSRPDITIIPLRISATSPLAGKTLAESNLRRLYGVSVLAVQRGKETLPNVSADMRLHENDVIIVMGAMDAINRLRGEVSL
ncbi:MAG: cation:proton antiporter [Candidatus Eremiobacteraeota bacterium]|nr:cation:proton antiporter [Candidatus Eremiobacteraeota bacterium]